MGSYTVLEQLLCVRRSVTLSVKNPEQSNNFNDILLNNWKSPAVSYSILGPFDDNLVGPVAR